MASFASKLKLNTALDSRSTFDLSSDHITTMEFFENKVTYIKEMVPKETLDVNVESFCRLSPLTLPTFGRCKIVHRAFFVPNRVIMPDWNAFITQSPSEILGTVINKVPTVKNNTILSALGGNQGGTTYWSGTTGNVYDNKVIYTDGKTSKHILTKTGRWIIDLLSCLGIRLSYNMKDTTTEWSLLPVLAYLKICDDWFKNTNVDIDIQVPEIINSLRTGTGDSEFSSILSALKTIGKTVNYEPDYFTSAFMKASGPSVNTNTIMTIPNIDGGDAIVNNEDLNSGAARVYGNNIITQYTVDTLKHLSDFLKRHQLAGSRAVDRYLARFGVNLSAEKLNRSQYLGSDNVNVQVGEVMSNADTGGAVLGDYAGRGVAYSNNGKFNYTTDEYGYFIVISRIVPEIGYVQGFDRMTQHIKPLDFFTPEFDALGNQAIAQGELFMPNNASRLSGSTTAPYNVFGYTPRYAEYKTGRNKLTGDYQFGSINAGQDAWHLNRMFADTTTDASTSFVMNKEFIDASDSSNSGKQFDRIFNAETNIADHFNCIFHFDVKCTAPMKQLYDGYEFHNKGQEITMKVNGSHTLDA